MIHCQLGHSTGRSVSALLSWRWRCNLLNLLLSVWSTSNDLWLCWDALYLCFIFSFTQMTSTNQTIRPVVFVLILCQQLEKLISCMLLLMNIQSYSFISRICIVWTVAFTVCTQVKLINAQFSCVIMVTCDLMLGSGLKLKLSATFWSLSVMLLSVQILVVHITCLLLHPKMFTLCL